MKLSLKFADGRVLNFETKKTTCLIGRSDQCDLILREDGVSRRHCLLEFKGEGVTVLDLKSSLGTFVMGAPVSTITPTPVPSYGVISFGPVVELTVNVDEELRRTVAAPIVLSEISKKTKFKSTRSKIQSQKFSKREASPATIFITLATLVIAIAVIASRVLEF